MKLAFAKIDRVVESTEGKVLHVPAGGIQFEMRNTVVLLNEPVAIEMDHSGMFKNVLRDVEFVVYKDLSLNPQEVVQKRSLFSIVAHDEFYGMVYEQLRHCKVVPYMSVSCLQQSFQICISNYWGCKDGYSIF